jgi:Xaa-Pro dipeptidase
MPAFFALRLRRRVPITEDARKQDRCDLYRTRPEHVLLHRHALGHERAHVAVVIPARGEIAWVCPKFEEERARELITMGTDIRTWEEDESPYQRVAEIFRDRGIRTGRVGMEERVRFFLFDGIRKAAPALQFVSATPITAGCRMFKSPAEIALMQRANDITIAAYKATIESTREGMTQDEFSGKLRAAFRALGVQGGVFCSFGKYTAFPHGSSTPQKLKEGDVVLMDGGCGVEGYQSDITRTFVFGKPTSKTTRHLEPRTQVAGCGFAAAKVGAPCEAVDAAARKGDHRRGLWSGLQSARTAASHRPRHRPRWTRMDKLCARQQDADSTGNVF